MKRYDEHTDDAVIQERVTKLLEAIDDHAEATREGGS